MKAPTVASLKKVTPDNLAALGAERLAAILVSAGDASPDLKRRLRMELAAVQGGDHLAVEIDRRLGSLQTSRSKVSWRKRAAFTADLDVLRELIAERLSGLDRPGALERLWNFMDLSRRLNARVRDRDGTLAQVFQRAAADIGDLFAAAPDPGHAPALVEAIARHPLGWADWLPAVLDRAPPGMTQAALGLIRARPDSPAAVGHIARLLADRSGDIEAFRATFVAAALTTPAIAAEIARRLLASGRTDEAGAVLAAARPSPRDRDPDYDWESVHIDHLQASGEATSAQDARWASFERTLSVERARAFTSRLKDFDDVEAEARAFAHAAGHRHLALALSFLIDWPALAEAVRLLQTRTDDLDIDDDLAEAWAGKLRDRHPAAAADVLRRAATAAFRRREFKASKRLTKAADEIDG